MIVAKLQQDVHILAILEKHLESHDPRVLKSPMDLDLCLELQRHAHKDTRDFYKRQAALYAPSSVHILVCAIYRKQGKAA